MMAAQSKRMFSVENRDQQDEFKVIVKDDHSIKVKEQFLQFSKDPIMHNFGELPFGEIPEPLKYVRPHQLTTLSNGVRVCTEQIAGATANVGVYIKAGSRQEKMDTSGSAYLSLKMMERGTTSRSKAEIEEEIENVGSKLDYHTDREHQRLNMHVFKDDVSKAISLLGDMVVNSSINDGELELAKQDVINELENMHKQYQETSIENAHFNSFRDHYLGQPKKGNLDNIPQINTNSIREYRAANYVGDHIVVVATGDVDHQAVVQQVEQQFGSLQKSAQQRRHNSEKAIYTPSLQMMRDDEMYNTNVTVFYDAPGYNHRDYWAFELLKEVNGHYRIDQHAGHLNDTEKQYNALHTVLGELVDVTRHDAHYFTYSDCGLWGNYFFGNEVFTRNMNYAGVGPMTIKAHHFQEAEVVRARNKMYNDLLHQDQPEQVNLAIGEQILKFGRRVPRSEVAKRLSHMNAWHMKHLCNDWFYDAEPSFMNWGPCESTSAFGSYRYFKMQTTSSIFNFHHTLMD
jgi:processing peptidase subunit beta